MHFKHLQMLIEVQDIHLGNSIIKFCIFDQGTM